MEVLYEEGLASHFGPESCVHTGNDVGEALTGGTASRVIEPRKAFEQGASVVVFSEGQHRRDRGWRGRVGPCVVGEHRRAFKLPARKPGGPRIGRAEMAVRSAVRTLRG